MSQTKPFLIVGLGNPGEKYSLTRHNIGFLAVDYLAQQWGGTSCRWQKEHHSITCKVQPPTSQVQALILAKPQTFMNLSGDAVQSLLSFYKIPLSQMLVIHDDLDMPFGTLKLVVNRGHGGQNGVRHIHEKLGSAHYPRLKCGIGRPPHPDWNIADWVLSNWSTEETNALTSWLDKIEQGVRAWIALGTEKAANHINVRKKN